MYILTGLLFLLGYTAVETGRYVRYVGRKNKYNVGRLDDEESGSLRSNTSFYTRPGSYETYDHSVKAKNQEDPHQGKYDYSKLVHDERFSGKHTSWLIRYSSNHQGPHE